MGTPIAAPKDTRREEENRKPEKVRGTDWAKKRMMPGTLRASGRRRKRIQQMLTYSSVKASELPRQKTSMSRSSLIAARAVESPKV
jgi:hypothetical protein